MKLNPVRIRQMAGEKIRAAGRAIEEDGLLKVTEQGAGVTKYTAAGTPRATVTLTRDLDITCDCAQAGKQGVCPHIVAALLVAEKQGIPAKLLKMTAPDRGTDMENVMLRSMPAEPCLRLEVTLAPGREEQQVRIGLRIGVEKLYVVRDFEELFRARERREPLQFGTGFTYEPEWMVFSEEDEAVLRLIKKMISGGEKAPGAQGTAARMIPVPDAFSDELRELLKNRSFRMIAYDGTVKTYKGIREAELPMQFDFATGPRGSIVTTRIPGEFTPMCGDCSWGIWGGTAGELPAAQRELARMVWERQFDGQCFFEFPPDRTETVIGEILPWLKIRGAVTTSQDLRARLVRRELKPEVYLDRDGKSVAATVSFRYGEIEINPFRPADKKITIEKEDKLLLRDAEAEHRVLDIMESSGFRVGKECLRLTGSDLVFEFVSSGVRKLQEVSDVYLSREFKRIMPRRPMLRGNMRMHGDQIEFTLEENGEPSGEILELIEALSRKRKYFRLKSGEFLDLSEMAEWQEAAADIYDAAVRDGNLPERDALTLRAYRAGYLTSLLSNAGVRVKLDEEVKAISEALNGGEVETTPVMAPGMKLRDYQQRGLEWMTSLDRMHMGGILADDMGLGKTVQVIALLTTRAEQGKTSIVIAPTSLTYNWLSEIRHFAPELSAAVLSGTAEQRARLIEHIRKHGDVNVIITSYPLIRRDIDLMKEMEFRFVILDEAQNIKNAGSMAAEAVKKLKADTRFALTGTPMENGVGELWSLFDFVLPGYLPAYNVFLHRYQEGENADDLMRRIRPFLIRRLKQDVLDELPDKIEVVMTANMTDEQKTVYAAELERTKHRVERIMEAGEINRNRMEILSAITELREICCHPSLVLENYRGSSGKTEMLMDILPRLIQEGRRILIFSQFTRMLKLLRRILEEKGIQLLYLDGDTHADERLRLTERFNGGEGQVFLISLRAGGSGLNLTGADTVIHYDPWWNPATEDQATDRAHRIGQTKKVQVIRMVTAQTIEEQVAELGTRKKALFDRLITPGESSISGLSEQDIRNLFA